MKTGSISLINLHSNGNRADASFHLSEGIAVRRALNKSPYGSLTIDDVSTDVFYGNRAHRVYVQDINHGIRFLSSSDILLADYDNVKYASLKYTPNIDQLRINNDWILITRSGTIGNCAYTNSLHSECLSSEDVIRVIPNGKMPAGVIYAFLSTSFGHSLLTQGTFGAVIQHIEPDFVRSIPIPCFSNELQVLVDNKVKESARLREKAASYKHEAISLFEKFLSSVDSPRYNTISFKQLCSHHHRFDTQYQSEILTEANDNLDLDSTPIQFYASQIYVGNRGKRHYVAKGIPFLSSSDMMLFNPKRWASQISVRTPSLDSLRVRENDILISRSGTVGNCVFVSSGLQDVTISEHALRLRIDHTKIAPEYVFTYLCTWQGQRKLKNIAYGSVIITLGEEFVGEISVPSISKDSYEKIIQLIRNYHTCLDEASKLDTDAISLLKQEIESWSK